ncbi:MAG: hypothetical protein RIC17_14060 [Gammaproteobacteria bacterium]
MDDIYSKIYNSLSLEQLPGIVSFEKVTGKPLTELAVAANEFSFGALGEDLNFEESFGGGPLDADEARQVV